MGRFSRFENLEGPRPAHQEDGEPRASGRFEALETSMGAGVSEAPAAGAGRARFEGEPPLELDERPPGGWSFLRCLQCGADSNVGSSRCFQCGAWLDTPDQAAFNAQLQEQRRAEAEEARAAVPASSPPETGPVVEPEASRVRWLTPSWLRQAVGQSWLGRALRGYRRWRG
jgi:hypothetical protein